MPLCCLIYIFHQVSPQDYQLTLLGPSPSKACHNGICPCLTRFLRYESLFRRCLGSSEGSLNRSRRQRSPRIYRAFRLRRLWRPFALHRLVRIVSQIDRVFRVAIRYPFLLSRYRGSTTWWFRCCNLQGSLLATIQLLSIRRLEAGMAQDEYMKRGTTCLVIHAFISLCWSLFCGPLFHTSFARYPSLVATLRVRVALHDIALLRVCASSLASIVALPC